jgi:hypothetical protein
MMAFANCYLVSPGPSSFGLLIKILGAFTVNSTGLVLIKEISLLLKTATPTVTLGS